MIPLNRCVIITTYQSASIKESFDFTKDDYVICADGGYSHARAEGIDPDIVVGDFDSIGLDYIKTDLKNSGLDSRCRIIRVPVEKNDTDTLICLKHGIKLGFEEFFILGGLGGRLDHTLANLQTMSYAVDQQKAVWFLDGRNRATLRGPGALIVKNPGNFMISLFAFGESCEGVTIRGVKYPLDHYRMINSFPIGVSNEFAGDEAEISHTAGKLLIILAKD